MKYLILLTLTLTSFSSYAFDDVEEYYADNCVACHSDENILANVPIIAGLQASFLKNQFKAFANGKRKDTAADGIMNDLMEDFTADDMSQMSKYIAGLNSCDFHTPDSSASAQVIAEGETLAKEKKCMTCHQTSGGGAGPSLVGQKQDYIAHAINAFKDKEIRKSPVMNPQAEKLSPEEAEKVAAYYNSLGSCE